MIHHTRRTFVKAMAASATVIAVVKWPPPLAAQMVDPVQPPPSPGWGPVPGQARYRIDGFAKVTGQKIYARDFRPGDIPGWPRTAAYVYVLRAIHADRPFMGLALDRLPSKLRPVTTILQKDLDDQNIATPWFDSVNTFAPPPIPPLMVELQSVPVYLGQPVAMLVFDDEITWREASRLMQFDDAFIQYGASVPPAAPALLGEPSTYYFIRYSQDGHEVFSQVLAQAYVDPTGTAACDQEAKKYQQLIDGLLNDAPAHGWRKFESTTTTQTIDPMFMEPQTGMAFMRMEEGKRVLDIVVGTQSPDGDAQTLCSSVLMGAQNHPDLIRMYSCYPGGGFGGRDTSLFTYFLAIAAAFVHGRAIRIEWDRFGQFQGGLKRNGSSIRQAFAVDGEGKLRAVQSSITIVGGGKMNYSPYVAELAGICGAGAYSVPANDIAAFAKQSIGPTAGSMRGFGGPQAFFAVEHLMDEIAAAQHLDPIELRLRNVLKEGDHTVTGAPLTAPLTLREICERARETPLWKHRHAEQKRRAGGSTAYGVGFALANQAFGTGSDPVYGNVAIEPDGRVIVTTNAVDMGNGSATSLALAPSRWLGTNASSIDMGNILFSEVLNLTTSSTGEPECGPANPCVILPTVREAKLQALKRSRSGRRPRAKGAIATPGCPAPAETYPWTTNSRFTESLFASSSACITAFHQTHVIEQVSEVVFLAGILPAAATLWKIDSSALAAANAHWEDGKLVARGLPPLPLAALAAEAHRAGLVTGATAHAFYQGRWVAADYTIGGTTYVNRPVDALAVRSGAGAYERVIRRNVVPPAPDAQYYGRSLYAPSGTLAAVEIEKRTGAIRLLDVITWVDAGRPIQRQLLAGQFEGAVGIGFGYTFLEHMPQEAGGAGDGRWNLNRYGLALASDLPPLGRMRLVTLNEEALPKGIAEAVLCPLAPAFANAASHATGRFYRSLPITAAKLMEAFA